MAVGTASHQILGAAIVRLPGTPTIHYWYALSSKGVGTFGSIQMASRLDSVFLTMRARLCSVSDPFNVSRRCEEPLEALLVANQANSRVLACMMICTDWHHVCIWCISGRTHESGQLHSQWQIRLAALANSKQGSRDCFSVSAYP